MLVFFFKTVFDFSSLGKQRAKYEVSTRRLRDVSKICITSEIKKKSRVLYLWLLRPNESSYVHMSYRVCSVLVNRVINTKLLLREL